MNKKGFTLVEILAAVTVLALLALITVPAVTKPIKDSKNDLYKTQLKSFKDSAKAWVAQNMFSNLLPTNGSCTIVNLDTLIDEGLVDPNVKNPKNGDEFASGRNGVFVKIINEGTNTSDKFVYQVFDCSSDTCYSIDSDDEDYSIITQSCN